GLQAADREFSAIGEEAFVQPVDTSSVGVFWVGEKDLGEFDLEAGARVERVEHTPTAGQSRDFSLFSASLGFVRNLNDAFSVSGVVDVSSRAPVSEELYSDGPHLATQTFDVGDDSLDREDALNASLTLQYNADRWGYSATVFYTDFSDFIYQTFTGEEEDSLAVAPYVQNDARFTGLDVSAYFGLGDYAGATWQLDALFDTVDATVSASDSKFLPRISPTRIGVGVSGQWSRFNASLDLLRVAAVDDVSANELPTDAYNDVRVDLGWRQPLARGELSVFLRGRNLTNDEQRNHTSYVKDFVPLPGRNVEVGARLSF
ncbi:MAG: TonB-dependent receptor, partial [Pseudomonadota bacterium]